MGKSNKSGGTPVEQSLPVEKGGKKEKKKGEKREENKSADKETVPGVIYISRVPPKMTPSRLKSLLAIHGEVGRVYLEQEDPSVRKRRIKSGAKKNTGKRYTEGWVELADKKIAKRVALGLNNTPIEDESKGRNIRNGFGSDLWALKYLKGFSWNDLTEKVAYERRVRESKLKLEMVAARREEMEFKERVEEGGKFEQMVERKGGLVLDKDDKDVGDVAGGKFKRKFKQTGAITNERRGKKAKKQQIDSSVLNMLVRK